MTGVQTCALPISIIIEELQHFNLKQTLECGQCFRYENIGENEYFIVAKGRLLHVKQEGGTLFFFESTLDEVMNVWIPYFDLDRDYGEIKEWLITTQPPLQAMISIAWKNSSPERILSSILLASSSP